MSPFVLVISLGLVAVRGGRTVSSNLIAKPWRDLLGIAEVEHSSRTGKDTHPAGSGPRRILSELVVCPICSGAWVAILTVGLYALFPEVGTVLIYALAAAGIGEILQHLNEVLQWTGYVQRERTGRLNHENKAYFEEQDLGVFREAQRDYQN